MASMIILRYVFNSLIHFEISKNAYLEFESDAYLIYSISREGVWDCPLKNFFIVLLMSSLS